MKKKLSLMITLCMLLLILPLPMAAAADAPEDAAKEATDAAGLLEQAKPLLDAKDYEAAVPLLQQAAEQGNAEAQNALGEELFDCAEVLVACPARSSEFMIIFLFMASAMTVSYSANSFFTESQSAFICETL